MNNLQKIKKTILIALGFGLATYLIINGMAMLDAEGVSSSESNTTSEVHSDTMK